MRPGRNAIQAIQALYSMGTMGSWTDGQLLTEFLKGPEGNDAALRVLIERHGPMVLGVCRRVLREEHAAEDAFQNTFLILVKKAEVLRDCDILTNWLFGVALRVARKENARATRRRVVERRAAGARPAWQADDLDRGELRAIIDTEISRLPERYRVPLILCHLEGLRHEDVARKLGCPVGTVESRLSRAREQLRSRLERRGLAPTASVIGLIGSPAESSAASGLTMAALTESTLEAAVKIVPARASIVTMLAHSLGRRALGFSTLVDGGVMVSAALLSAGMFPLVLALSGADGQPPGPAAGDRGVAASPAPASPSSFPPAVALSGADRQPPRPDARDRGVAANLAPASLGLSANESISHAPPVLRAEPIARPVAASPEQGPPKLATRDTRPRRTSSIDAAALVDITIDGRLDDWPPAIPRHAMEKLLDRGTGNGRGDDALPRGTNLSTSKDLSAAFSVGYDLESQLMYLAVIVRDDKVVLGHARPMDSDAVEVYVDGLHTSRKIPVPGSFEDEWNKLGLSQFPVQQYVAIPGQGKIFGLRQATNPVLIAGDLGKTRTRMAYRREGDVTIYEWAIQVFDRYPDRPTRLEPGKRIGFDIAVADKDVPNSWAGLTSSSDLAAWIYWGPEWRGVKVLDAGALGELILAH
jgi:RNA polymerase sigma factor (sigma-70 family)